MTLEPEKIQEIKASEEKRERGEVIHYIPPWMIIELCDMALRLAAIEGAGDEDIERALESTKQAKTFYEIAAQHAKDPAVKQFAQDFGNLLSMSRDIQAVAKSRNQVIADLRVKLGEAEERIKDLEGDIEVAKYGL